MTAEERDQAVDFTILHQPAVNQFGRNNDCIPALVQLELALKITRDSLPEFPWRKPGSGNYMRFDIVKGAFFQTGRDKIYVVSGPQTFRKQETGFLQRCLVGPQGRLDRLGTGFFRTDVNDCSLHVGAGKAETPKGGKRQWLGLTCGVHLSTQDEHSRIQMIGFSPQIATGLRYFTAPKRPHDQTATKCWENVIKLLHTRFKANSGRRERASTIHS
jgi:hypothetical protein